jgi:hypothetical protein
VDDDAHGEDIRSLVDRKALQLLGRHVAKCSYDRTVRSERLRCDDGRLFIVKPLCDRGPAGRRRPLLTDDLLGQTEVEQLHCSVRHDHDVLRLDVAVQEARGMGVHDRFQESGGNGQRLRCTYGASP